MSSTYGGSSEEPTIPRRVLERTLRRSWTQDRLGREQAAVSPSMQIVLGRVEIHVDVLRFISLFAIPDSSCEATTERMKKRKRTFSYDEKMCPPCALSRFLFRHPTGKKRKRERGDAQSSLCAHQAFNRDRHLLHDNNCTKKRNPRRRNFLKNVTFVLSSARVSSV